MVGPADLAGHTRKAPESPYFVQSMAKGLRVLACFADDGQPLGVTQLAARVGLDTAGTFRLLATLHELGYVMRCGRMYCPGPAALRLGLGLVSESPIRRAARPYLEWLHERTGLSVNLALLDGEEVLYMDRVPSRPILRQRVEPGIRLPAMRTALGKAILAHTSAPGRPEVPGALERDRVQYRGIAVADRELAAELIGVAAPVVDRMGAAVAAVGLAVPAEAGIAGAMTWHAALRQCAGRIAGALDRMG